MYAGVVLRVLTVETDTSPMEIDCHYIIMIIFLFCLKDVVLGEWMCTAVAVVVHLVYIAVILKPLQSIIIMAVCLCLLDSTPAEVRDNLLKREL